MRTAYKVLAYLVAVEVAVQAMVPRVDTNRIMDELYDLGARGILVTDIHACRL